MIGHRAVLFAEPLFYRQHLVTGGVGRAVDARHKAVERCTVLAARFLRFLGIDGIADNIGKLLSVLFGHIFIGKKFRVRRFIWIFYIYNHLAEPAFHTPD